MVSLINSSTECISTFSTIQDHTISSPLYFILNSSMFHVSPHINASYNSLMHCYFEQNYVALSWWILPFKYRTSRIWFQLVLLCAYFLLLLSYSAIFNSESSKTIKMSIILIIIHQFEKTLYNSKPSILESSLSFWVPNWELLGAVVNLTTNGHLI